LGHPSWLLGLEISIPSNYQKINKIQELAGTRFLGVEISLLSHLVYSQIWLNLIVIDSQFAYHTKFEKKKKTLGLPACLQCVCATCCCLLLTR